MDFLTLAPLVISAVKPYLEKGAEKITEKAAEEGFEQRGKIWNLVKGMFAEGDLTLLNLFEQNPEDAKTQGKLEGKLEDRLTANPEIAEQIDELIKQIPQSQGKQNTINQSGNDNIAVQDVSGSTVNISQIGGKLINQQIDRVNTKQRQLNIHLTELSLDKYSRKNFYFNLEGEGASGNAVEFGTLVDLVFDYNVPPKDAAAIIFGNILNEARLNNLSLNITVIPVGFGFIDAPENSYSRRISFKNGLMTEAARFSFRAANRETLTEIGEPDRQDLSADPETGFHVIFNVKGLTFEQLFLPVRLVDSIESDKRIRLDYEPLKFDLDSLQEFGEMADETNDKMQKLVDEILLQKEPS